MTSTRKIRPTFLLAAALCLAVPAPAAEVVTEPFQGVRRIELINPASISRPLYVNIVEIDLADPTLSFRMTPRSPGMPPSSGGIPAETQFQSTRNFLDQQNGQIAINASFFGGTYSGGWTNNLGLTASNGDAYSPWESAFTANFDDAINISQGNVALVVESPLQPPTGFETLPEVPLYNAVTGSHRLVQNGIVDPNNTFGVGGLNGLEPRTAIGVTNNLDSTAKKLLMMTVDGRQSGFSEGVTLTELANLMKAYGVTDAINLDGGGSTTMMVNYYGDADPSGSAYSARQLNAPINGNVPGGERSVGSNLALFAAQNPNFAPPQQPQVPAGYAILDDFEGGEGHFDGASIASGSTFGVSNSSLFDRVRNESHYGLSSQRLTVRTSNPGSPGMGLRHLSGGGAPGSNTSLASSGSIGFFLKVLQTGVQTGNIEASLIIDDGATAHERAASIDVIADGQWHLYQWDLDDAGQWDSFTSGNGTIDAASVTVDSIYLTSSQNINFNVFFDLLVHNPNGNLDSLVPDQGQLGDFDDDEDVDGADFLAWQRGESHDPLSPDDLADWKDNFGLAPSSVTGTTVPEPSACVLACIAASLAVGTRQLNKSQWRLGSQWHRRLGELAGVIVPLQCSI